MTTPDASVNDSAPDTEEKLNFKKILPIFMIVLVDLMGLTIILPALTHYAASFGASAAVIGLLMAAYPLSQLFGGPLLGGLSDRFGRKPVLVVSQFGTFAGFMLMGFANSLMVLFIARIIDGISGGNIVAAQAAITDSTTEKTRTAGLGLVGAAFGLGFTVGPAIGGTALALTDNNYAAPAFIAAAFSMLSLLLTIFWFDETLTDEKRAEQAAHAAQSPHPRRGFIFTQFGQIAQGLRSPLVGALLLLMFFQQFVFATYEQLLPLFDLSRLGLNAAENTPLFLLIGLIAVLVQGKYIGIWSRRFGDHKLVYAAIGLMALGMTMIALTPHQAVAWYDRDALLTSLAESGGVDVSEVEVTVPDGSNTGWLGLAWLVVAIIPASVGGSMIRPTINSIITKRVPPKEIGVMLGVSMALVSAANAITPIVGGAMIQVFGPGAPFLVSGLLMTALLFYALQRVRPMTPPVSESVPVEIAPAPGGTD